MNTCHTSPIPVERTSLVCERHASPSRSRTGMTATQLTQNSDIAGTPSFLRRARILEKTSRGRRRMSSPSDTTHNMSDKDFNAPPFLPPVIQHLSLYVNRAKTRFKPYKKNGPSMWALRFAESSVAPQSDLSLMDVHNGKHQLQLGLSDLSSEAIAQAVLTKEADVEYRHLSAMAMAWRIEATERHTKFLHMLLEQAADKYVSTSSEDLETLVPALASSRKEELGDHRDFSVAAYSHDAASFAAADEQLNHLETLARDHYGSGSDLAEDCKQEEPELPTESDGSSMGCDQAPVALP